MTADWERRKIVKGQKRVLHEVMQSHGLRKFFETQAVGAGMDLFTAEYLMGHKGGQSLQSYVKPTFQQLYDKYIQIVDAVTINEENKLRREVQTLKIRADKIEGVMARLAEMERRMGLE